MIYTHLITFAMSAIMAFWGGIEFNQMRHDANEKQAIEQAALDKQELHRMEQARSSAALAVQVLARKSEAVLRNAAAASKSELDSLRSQSTSALL